MTLRARGRACSGWPQVGVYVDGRRVGRIPVRSRRWRRYRRPLPLAAGRHTIALRLVGRRERRHCVRRAVVDWLALTAKPPPPPPAPARATPAIGGPTFRNPVFEPAADPMVLDRSGTHSRYFMYATGGGFPMARSSDLVHWTGAGEAMPDRPAWAAQSGDYNPWAPSVIEKPQPCPGEATGPCFVMFFTARHATMDPPANCIGVATSPDPEGPFADLGPLPSPDGGVDQSGRPIGCGDDGGYSNIDAAPFVDAGGAAHLYLSTGHHCATVAPHLACPWDRTISVIPLRPDLLGASGPRKRLFAAGSAWEASVVENPWVRRRGGVYELFYSGGVYTGAYGMGYATGPSPSGPFTKSALNPLLHDSSAVKSAGGGSLVTGPRGGAWVAYHGRSGSYSAPRVLRMDPVRVRADGAVTIAGPSTARQAVP